MMIKNYSYFSFLVKYLINFIIYIFALILFLKFLLMINNLGSILDLFSENSKKIFFLLKTSPLIILILSYHQFRMLKEALVTWEIDNDFIIKSFRELNIFNIPKRLFFSTLFTKVIEVCVDKDGEQVIYYLDLGFRGSEKVNAEL